MLVMERLVGTDPARDSWIAGAVGRAKWRRLLQDLATVPLITLPEGWKLEDGRALAPVQTDDYEALMQPRGPRGGRLPR